MGHDEKSFRAKGGRFDSRATLPKLGFVSVQKPLLKASYHKVVFKVTKSKDVIRLQKSLCHVHQK